MEHTKPKNPWHERAMAAEAECERLREALDDELARQPGSYAKEIRDLTAEIERLQAALSKMTDHHKFEYERAERAERELADLDGPLGLMHTGRVHDPKGVRYQQALKLRRERDEAVERDKGSRDLLAKHDEQFERVMNERDEARALARCDCGAIGVAPHSPEDHFTEDDDTPLPDHALPDDEGLPELPGIISHYGIEVERAAIAYARTAVARERVGVLLRVGVKHRTLHMADFRHWLKTETARALKEARDAD